MALLALSPWGVDLARFAMARNLSHDEAEDLWQRVDLVRLGRAGEAVGIAPDRWQGLRDQALSGLAKWHEKSPDRFGPAENALRLSFEKPPQPALFDELIADLAASGDLVSANRQVRLPDHQPALADKDEKLWAIVRPALEQGGLQPPAVHDLARDLGLAPDLLFGFLRRTAAQGLVLHIGKNRFLMPAAVRELGEIAESLALTMAGGMITAAAFRGESGIGRNLAIEVLEHFDKVGYTKRTGDARSILKPASQIFGTLVSPP